MIRLVFSDPVEGLDLPKTTTLGPFSTVYYEGGWFYGDGELVAEVFQETASDMLNVFGHPSAGKVFIPRTFHAYEREHPDYPGRGYGRISFEVES